MTTDDSGDPAKRPVCRAFQLGWDMSCLYRQARPRSTRQPFAVTTDSESKTVYPKLPAKSDLSGGDKTERRLVAVEAGLFRLGETFDRGGLEHPDVGPAWTAFKGTNRKQLKGAVFTLYRETLLRLQASDTRLGRAFNLGRALEATRSSQPGDLPERFERNRVNGLRNELDDLVSALPAHAGRAVSFSLCWWQRALAPALKDLGPGAKPKLARRLDRQGEMWRSLLSGEKDGRDLLEIPDYLSAATRLVDHAAEIGRTTFRTYRRPLAISLVILVVAVALAVFLGGPGGTIAAVTGIAAAFGISWHGIGATTSSLTKALQEPLWGAELDLAVAEAITHPEVRRAYRRLRPKPVRGPLDREVPTPFRARAR